MKNTSKRIKIDSLQKLRNDQSLVNFFKKLFINLLIKLNESFGEEIFYDNISSIILNCQYKLIQLIDIFMTKTLFKLDIFEIQPFAVIY